MADILDLSRRLEQRRQQQEEADQYDDALEVLNDILSLADGQALFIFNIRGKLKATRVSGSRFYQVDPDSLV